MNGRGKNIDMLTVKQYAKGATIPQNYLRNAQLTVNILNEIFDTYPNQFTFNSGYRTPSHNRAVGGVANSYHVQALAGDITPRNGNYNQYKTALTAIVAKYGWELIDERNKNHFHIEPRSGQIAITVQTQPVITEPFSDPNPNPGASPQPKTAPISTGAVVVGLLLLVLLLRD